MSSHQADVNLRPQPDQELVAIADYLCNVRIDSAEAMCTAGYCMMDSLGCALLALHYPECSRHLGPIVPGTRVPHAVKVPGTAFQLDPIKAAWDIGTMLRWLDFNDTWLAAEWGHPSDNLGAILGLGDYLSRKALAEGGKSPSVGDLLGYLIKAYEIQGVLALENSFNGVGLDHVLLVKVASAGVSALMLGQTKQQIIDSLSQAWVDGAPLRTYRQAPNTGLRKSWAAGDASSRGLHLAMLVSQGEGGLPSVLSAPTWGFYETLFNGSRFRFQRDYGSYVMENVLFKVRFPAEFHAQTAVECAMMLHHQVKHRIDEIERIEVHTQEAGLRIISKEGPLHNSADRDHCLQYMIAVPLIFGHLRAEDYADDIAADPRIDALRERMRVCEEPRYTKDYHDPNKRAIGNAVQVFFNDGSSTSRVELCYPIGHRRRRAEAIPLLEAKFLNALNSRFTQEQVQRIQTLCADQQALQNVPVCRFMDLFALQQA